jgi:lantibiotic transport system permease protein
MNFYLSLRSELLKTRRTSSVYLTLLVATLMPLLYFFDYATDATDAAVLKSDPWQLFFLEGWKALNFVLLPWYVILVCTLVPQIEHRNHTWKQVLASPQPTSHVFFAKFLRVQGLIGLFFLMHNALMLFAATSLHFITPELPFLDHPFDVREWLWMNAKTYIAILPISVLQFWMGMRFKNFVTPIGIGLGLWFAGGMLVYEIHWAGANLFPYAYPQLCLLPKFSSEVPFIQTCVGVYTALFLLLAFADFNGKREKG